VCRRIVQELNRPFAIEGNDVAIGVSMGIALAPGIAAAQTIFYATRILRCIRRNNPAETDGSIIARICRKS
jgi:predicted signal transduction protein with EAL and GGDEF domain